jgi:hypothetical protein
MRKIIAGIIFFSMLISLPTTVTAAGEDEPPDTTGATDETTPRTARASSKTTEPFTEDPPDIMGNAQIVEKQEIIFSDGAFEFISVTTKNGNVFYIFIRHDLEAGAANVYFLNKVDERDLLSLLAADDEIDDVVTSASRPAGVTQKTEPDASKSPEPAPPQKEPQSADAAPAIPLINIIIVGGVIVIVCGVLLFTRFKHKRETGPNRGEEDEEDEYEGGNDYPDDDYDKGD